MPSRIRKNAAKNGNKKVTSLFDTTHPFSSPPLSNTSSTTPLVDLAPTAVYSIFSLTRLCFSRFNQRGGYCASIYEAADSPLQNGSSRRFALLSGWIAGGFHVPHPHGAHGRSVDKCELRVAIVLGNSTIWHAQNGPRGFTGKLHLGRDREGVVFAVCCFQEIYEKKVGRTMFINEKSVMRAQIFGDCYLCYRGIFGTYMMNRYMRVFTRK